MPRIIPLPILTPKSPEREIGPISTDSTKLGLIRAAIKPPKKVNTNKVKRLKNNTLKQSITF